MPVYIFLSSKRHRLCHCEERSDVAISWYCVRFRTVYQEIPTACGLGMTP